MPSSSSRDIVQVLLRDKRSMRRSVSALKRTSAVSGTYSTFAGSPSPAAATALQKSTSKPRKTPDPSFSEKPGSPSLTPQINLSLDRTSSSVPAAAFGGTTTLPRKNAAAAQTMKRRFKMWDRRLLWRSCELRIVKLRSDLVVDDPRRAERSIETWAKKGLAKAASFTVGDEAYDRRQQELAQCRY